MHIEVQLTDAAIPACLPPPPRVDLGAWVEFRGVVRGDEDGHPIAALDYEAYVSMAKLEMHRIIVDIARRWPCLAVRVIHRTGIVPVGEAAIYVGIAGQHRAEAFAFLCEFMDRLKQDVPIWKMRELPAIPGKGSDSTAGPNGRARGPIQVPQGSRPATPTEVLTLIRQLARPLEPERVPLADAVGRVLRETIRAPEDQPCFNRASVDGYAVRIDDASAQFLVVDEIRAGDWKPRVLQPGQTVRIATGAAVPGDDLRVVMKEDAEVQTGTITLRRCETERNIRVRGEDARAGQELIRSGTVLRSGALGLLASLGCTEPMVARLPRVLHLTTGNELVLPHQKPGKGQIRDSNTTLVRSFLGQWGIVPAQRRVGEDEASIQLELDRAQSELDLLLISGGASVGEHDFTRALLAKSGFVIHMQKTSARPGKPLIVAQRGSTVAFGLPGNPLAHFVCLNLYVRAALDSWMGRPNSALFDTGTLATRLAASDHVWETFWPAEWRLEQGSVALTPLPWRSSGDLTCLAKANALIHLVPGTKGLTRGSSVEFARAERTG